MKKTTILFFFTLFFSKAINAQISTLPYSEGFENPFVQGNNIDFVPNFNGNIVASTNRIFQDAANHYSGAASCAVTPTSSFDGAILISMNLASYSNVFLDFYAASAQNGTGTRPAFVEISTSGDGGVTFSPATQMGDSASFANANTVWNNYHYDLPYYSNLNSNVVVKIKVSRGDGTGTAARWLFDDFSVDFNSSDVTAPFVFDAFATSLTDVSIAFNEPVNGTAIQVSNYLGVGTIANGTVSSVAGDTISLHLNSPLVEGQWYTISIFGVQDNSSNPMLNSQDFVVVFNDNFGNVKITEINYDNPGNDSLAFVEIKNLEPQAINVGGWKFEKGLSGFLPSGAVLQPGEYMVVAQYPTAVNTFFGISSSAISGSLSNSGEAISIINSSGTLIDSVAYSNISPWDSLANGYGPSLVLCDENSNNDDPANWSASTHFAGLYLTSDSIFATPMNNCSMTAGIAEANTVTAEIFPNPARTIIHIKTNTLSKGNDEADIYDIYGRKVIHNRLPFMDNETQIDISSLSNGIYTIRIAGAIQKFIKE